MTERMDMDQVYESFGDESSDSFSQYVLEAAINACDWMNGVLAADEGAPSDGWIELIQE